MRFFLGSRWRSRLASSLTGMPDKSKLSGKLCLFSIVKDEIFLLAAFLSHHRSIGVDCFVILVDGSQDGTLEFLDSQRDVHVVTSSLKYGDQVNASPLARLGLQKMDRVGPLLKRVITSQLFDGSWGLYLDVDEFLFLPPNVRSLRDLIHGIDCRGRAVVASVIEFFPKSIASMQTPAVPLTLDELLANYGYFQKDPVYENPRRGRPRKIGLPKSTQLAQQLLGASTNLPGIVYKTPLIRHSRASFRWGSHKSSYKPIPGRMLTIGHFKFTADSWRKNKDAVASKSHHHEARSYSVMTKTLEASAKQGGELIDELSVAFTSPNQFIEHGHMVWPKNSGVGLCWWRERSNQNRRRAGGE